MSDEYIAAVIAHYHELPGGQLLQSTAPILIPDIYDLPDTSALKQLARMDGFRALALWPMVYEGQVQAAAACYHNQPYIWKAEQQEVMQAFTRQAAVALQNALLFDETRRRAAQQEALNAIIVAAVTSPDIRSLLDEVLRLLLDAFALEHGGIWARNRSVIIGLADPSSPSSESASAVILPDHLSKVVVEDRTQMPHDHPAALFLSQAGAKYGLCAFVAVPLMAEGRRIGDISLASLAPRRWLAEEVALLETVGHQLGSAIERLSLLTIIQEQARQVRQIMDSVPEGVVLLDAEQKIVLANPAARVQLCALDQQQLDIGSRLASLAGKPVDELLHMEPEMPWTEIETQGKQRRVFEIAARPMNAELQTEGWVLVLRDVTQERENQARIQMQDRLATVGQLAAGIAHDFNNIMAAILVYSDLLSMEPQLSGIGRERLNTIQRQVQRATSLIRQILDFSRRAVMEQSTLDLLPFIKELDKLLGRVLPENIRLELTYQPGAYLVNADPTRLQQVFMNLALNSRDAMPDGGLLRFEVDRMEIHANQTPQIPDLTPGAWIRIQVKDNGSGIPAELMPRVFDPFFTTKPVGQGTGLGLAQVYGIIKQHGGSIDVASQVGQGTTFMIYLPAVELPQQQHRAADDLPQLNGSGKTVLLVEDDWAARDALRALLETQNYHVLVASTGTEALETYSRASDKISLVVSDIVMPEMGGLALYQALHEREPGIKMLFITGHPLDDQNQALLQEGQVHWLQKPFAVQDFSRLLVDLLKAE